MAKRAKAPLETEQREAVAARGYDNDEAVKQCLADGLGPYLPKPNTSANRKLGLCGKEDFLYEATQEC
jgi:hypothetical protein